MEKKSRRKSSTSAFARTAISAAVGSMFLFRPAFAQEEGVKAVEASPGEPSGQQPIEPETIVVTGSRLRRVDKETASPVYTIDRASIESSGYTTPGQLLQEMPGISGAATNPQVNNGGGDGGATVSLRGLGDERTLVLLDGRRLGASFDINSIPVNMIERVDVLKEGAGAIYGSDAIGGVVNIITRKNYTGLDLAIGYGESSRGDAENPSVEALWGIAGDKGHVTLGLNYNKQNKVSAANRGFSKHALYIYNYYGADTIITLGSSRTPNGRITLPASVATANGYGTTDSEGVFKPCGSVTRTGPGSSPADYRCYSGASDAYDYQPYNLVVTPQERGSIFSTASYNVNDSVEVFSELFHTYQRSGFKIAPLPFDARSDNVVISSASIYNPFGIDFGGAPATPSSPVNPNFLSRPISLGPRFSQVETTTDQITGGARGSIGTTSWTWDLGLTYQRVGQVNAVSGYLLQSRLQDAVGPSFIDTGGTARCGTAGAPIPNCTPINIFNTESPDTVTALQNISTGYENRDAQTRKIAELNFNGDLFRLPAGSALGAIGFSYRDEHLHDDVDGLTQAFAPDFKNCQLSSETCSGDTSGDDKVWEVYGEAFVPLLADLPGIKQLNATFGLRYSDYNSFGSTTNGTVKLEYRPIGDLLVRASYAEIFRAPQITDRYSAPAASAPVYFDPCAGLTADAVAANPNLSLACQNVPTDGSYKPANIQIQQLITSNPDLDPETGNVITFGFVYDPNYLPGFSATIDLWRYKIDDAIISPDVNTISASCVSTGSPETCGLISRYSDGQISQILSPTFNSATYKTDGADVGLRYRLSTELGIFSASAEGSYTHSFKYSLLQGTPETEAAGAYDSQFGNYAKWRGLGTLGWKYSAFEAQWKVRYINGVTIAASSPTAIGTGRPAADAPLKVGSVTYHDVTIGYTAPTNTKFLIGVNNVFDKQPPLFYQYVLNANTNVETYDAIGSYMFVRVSQSF